MDSLNRSSLVSQDDAQRWMNEIMRSLKDANFIGSQLIEGGIGVRYDFDCVVLNHQKAQITIDIYDRKPIFLINHVVVGENSSSHGLNGDFSFNEFIFGAQNFNDSLRERYWTGLWKFCRAAQKMRYEAERMMVANMIVHGDGNNKISLKKITPMIYDFLSQQYATNYSFQVIDKGFFNNIEETRFQILATDDFVERTYQGIVDEYFPDLEREYFPIIDQNEIDKIVMGSEIMTEFVAKDPEHFWLRIRFLSQNNENIPHILEIPKEIETLKIAHVAQLEKNGSQLRLLIYEPEPDVDFKNYRDTEGRNTIDYFISKIQAIYNDEVLIKNISKFK